MEKNHMEQDTLQNMSVDIYTLLQDVLANWKEILMGALAAAMLAFVIVQASYVPEYTTSMSFFVTAKRGTSEYSSVTGRNTKALTFEKVFESSIMKKLICEKLGVSQIDAVIDAQVPEGVNIIELYVTTNSPKDSIDIIRVIKENYQELSAYTVGSSVLDVLDEPEIPYTAGNSLNVRSTVILGFLAGGIMTTALFAVLAFLKDTVRQEEDIEKKLDAKSLGVICFEQKYHNLKEWLQRNKKPILVSEPMTSFSFVEDYKKLVGKITYKLEHGSGKVITVSSVAEDEGKSTVAANIALTLAEQSYRVLLLDGDFHRPAQFLIMNMKLKEQNEVGELLEGKWQLKEVLKKTRHDNLYFLGGRNSYSSSLKLLNSEALPKLIKQCRRIFDYVIIDTPPAELLGDAMVFGQLSDGVVMVAKQNFTGAADINEVLDDFRDNHAKVLGVVLNGVKSFERLAEHSVLGSGRYGKYGGYYGRYGRYGRYTK